MILNGNKINEKLNTTDLSTEEDLFFLEEDSDITLSENLSNPWKIIIADDEEEVHVMTKMVLKKFFFEGRPLKLISAYSGKETIEAMIENDDVAMIILDVVMETENSGLDVVREIRDKIKNPFVRIILRTGQPGQAPEEDVIKNYDINDYKSKTELTVQKLYTAVISSLRSFRDMKTIEKNKVGLEKIISSSKDIFEIKSIEKFSNGILKQLERLLDYCDGRETRIDAAIINYTYGVISSVVGSGKYNDSSALSLEDEIDESLLMSIKKVIREKKSIFFDNIFIGYFTSLGIHENVILLEASRELGQFEIDLLKIFSSNVSIALENIYLNMEIIDTQKEVIFTLGEIVETRSKETANHVRRVAEYSYILAKAYGITEENAKILRLASPMHDIGKIGIPDNILNKPGKLTEAEFEIIKTHSMIGFEILKQSSRRIMKTAAMIALEHHERWDGLGYPSGKKAEEIEIFSRITSLVDVFDALGHKRVYKEKWIMDDILEYIKNERGKMFDPLIVDIFFKHIDEILEIRAKYPDND
ncbi:DUF3369 domain-containing protein [Helicovermis profundi]|uniref:Stage 0 sporulation protein A homolog n=1 Tax=Helicovermis profundi TaxID=3065157 RepID=A0AAU9ELG8_9FIRM|nr:response regulator [Clostridia bacterium S502]